MAKAAPDELEAISLFRALTPEDRAELLASATRLQLGTGEPVFLQGEPADAFFLVLSGTVEVRTGAAGSEQILAQLGPGSLLGETSLLVGGDHSASLHTIEPTTLLRFPNAGFREMLERGSRAAYRVLYHMAQTLAARLRAADADLAEMECRDAEMAPMESSDLERLRRIFFTKWAG